MNYLPQARTSNIVVQDFDKEVLIYDLQQHRALCLNQTSAFVWQKCDGKTTFDELKKLSGNKFNDDLILLTLSLLQKENLLEELVSDTTLKAELSRRGMIAKYGTLAIALPMISSLIAPTAVNAQSLTLSDCTNIPIPHPAGCTFGSSAVDCQTCLDTLTSTTSLVCASGQASINPLCTPNSDPAFVDCEGFCL